MLYARHHIRATYTQPRTHNCIHAVAFNLHSMHTASFKPLHPLSCIHTSLHSRLSTHAAAPGRTILFFSLYRFYIFLFYPPP